MIATKQSKIRVGIDGGDYCLLNSPRGGIQRLVNSFISTLQSVSYKNKEFYYYSFGGKQEPWIKAIKSKVLPMRFFSTFFLPFHILFDKIYIFLGFSGILPPFLRFFNKKSIIFIHDFGFYKFPQYYHDPDRMKWQSEYAIYGSHKIIVFSDYIKQQLFHFCPTIPHEKVVRIYPGVNHIKNTQLNGSKAKYFLYVGVIKPIKNIEGLFSLFSQYLLQSKVKSIKLILVGSREEEYFEKLLKCETYLKVKNNIIFVENISDQELTTYYQNSLALLNTSYEEGFCYPVIEALQLGKDVIVSDLPLYKEFAHFFTNIHITNDNKKFIEQMFLVINKKNDQKVLPHPFKWSLFTKEVLRVIDTLI